MSDVLKDFIKNNQEEFKDIPEDKLWNKIESELKQNNNLLKTKKISVIIKYGFGASLVIAGIFLVINSQKKMISTQVKTQLAVNYESKSVKKLEIDDATTSLANTKKIKSLIGDTNPAKKKLFLEHNLLDEKNNASITKVAIPGKNAEYKDTFEIVKIYSTYPNKLFWHTENEVLQLPFIIEQFHWKRWIKVGKVASSGKQGSYRYMIKVPLYSGENIFRIVQINDTNAYVFVSRNIKWTSDKPKVDYAVKKIAKEIRFSGATLYEILDSAGTLVKEGRGKAVSYNNLPKGCYVLNYDNYSAVFKR